MQDHLAGGHSVTRANVSRIMKKRLFDLMADISGDDRAVY